WSRPVTPGVGRSWNPADQDSEAPVAMHHENEWGPRPERERGDEVHILGKKIEPFCPFLDGLKLYLQRFWYDGCGIMPSWTSATPADLIPCEEDAETIKSRQDNPRRHMDRHRQLSLVR